MASSWRGEGQFPFQRTFVLVQGGGGDQGQCVPMGICYSGKFGGKRQYLNCLMIISLAVNNPGLRSLLFCRQPDILL